MKILGLAYGFHDSSAALMIDGQVVSASSEERFTRQKHDSFFPQFSIEECLQNSGLKKNELDLVVFYESSPKKFTRILASLVNQWPRGRREFTSAMKAWLGKKLWTTNQIVHRLGVGPEKVITLGHHEAHAYQAFLGSQFQDSAILIVDAVGEWSTTSLWEAQWIEGKPQLTLKSESQYPHSLGLFYSAMTAYLGFQPMNDECTTMALAAFGKARFADFFREIIQVREGEVWLDPDYFQFDLFYQAPFRQALLEKLGSAAKYGQNYSFSSFEVKPVTSEEQRWADIAASVQLVFEERMLQLVQYLKTQTKCSNLCVAGGAALNCVSNSRILNESGFENLFIPVDPGDGGASIGAAFYGYFSQKQTPGNETPSKSFYKEDLGPVQQSDSEFAEIVRNMSVKQLKKFASIPQPSVESWEVHEFATFAELSRSVADELWNYQIVGWFQDGFEFGPRALGHRSILIRPDHLDLALRLSTRVKERALYRPYALSMSEKAASSILVTDPQNFKQRPCEWMQLALPVKPEIQRKVKAGLHIDGTTRPQIVMSQNSWKYHELLEAFGRLSGLSCLINTSFNESGYPIVRTPQEALLMFARTDLDVLVVGQVLIKKVRTLHAT